MTIADVGSLATIVDLSPRDTRAAPRSRGRFVELLGEGQSPAAARAAPTTTPTSPTTPAGPSAAGSLRALLDRALKTERNVDVVLEAAARRRTFSPAELLAIQVQVFRYSQTVEVLSRATDKLVSAVKQTLGTQV